MDANLSIFKKGLLLVSIPLLAQLLLLAILAMVRLDLADAQHWAIHSKDVIARTETANRLIVEAHGAVRGFVLTGSDKSIDNFKKARAESVAIFADLSKLVADNPTQQARVAELARRTSKLMAWFDETIQLQQAGQQSDAATRLRSLEASERTDELRGLMREFLQEEERMDAIRNDHLQETARHQNLALGAGIVLTLVSTGLLVYTFSRGIGQRLGVLTDNVRRFAAGQDMAPPLAGRDEISQLDQAFHEMADTLEQKDRENEMFVYSVSHDLRAPLVNLQGFSQELATVCKDLRKVIADSELAGPARDRVFKLLDRDAAEAVQFIQTAVTRLSAIIDALLRLSRVGRVEYQKQTVDVDATVRRVVQSLGESITRRQAQVTVQTLPPAFADPLAVDQIFANLITNAVYYLDPQRPGTIEIGSQGASPSAEMPGMQVYFVKDNGLGIPAEHQAKAFLAFQRLHPGVAPGEGIGLALVRRVIERHGGKIWLTSTVGVGTTFYVALPQPPEVVDKAQEAA
jgi:signal transduction histidine kinase